MEISNHVPSPGDSHLPSCPHANACPHCGAPKASPYVTPYTQPIYPPSPYVSPWRRPFTGGWWNQTAPMPGFVMTNGGSVG